MSHLVRRIIFWSFLFLFIVLTIYFSLLASGYSILLSSSGGSYKFGFLQKTGILAVDSTPHEAEIELSKNFKSFLSSKEILKNKKIKTPYKVKNLIPGEYSLKVELDGYWPFEKKIYINPGQTTYIEDIILLKKTLPVMIFSSSVQNIKINNDSTHVIFTESGKLFNVDNESEIYLGDNVKNLSFVDSDYLLIDNKKIFNYKEKNSLVFSKNDVGSIYNLKTNNGNLYFLNDKGFLSSYSFGLQNFSTVLSESGVVDYCFSGSYVFVVLKTDVSTYLKVYSISDSKIVKSIEIPSYGDYKIIPSNNNLLFVYEEKFSSLYLIDPFSQISQIREVLKNVHDVNFIDNNSFVYYSDFELRIFNTSLMQDALISRFQNKIKSLLWHPKGYIIFSDGQSINAIDFRYDKYIVNLFTFDKISNLVLDKNGGSLYFTGKIANQEGLYKLFIQ